MRQNIGPNPRHDAIALLPLLPLAPDDVIPLGATLEQIELLQQRIGMPLPFQFQQWLSACNGPLVAQGVYGIRPDFPALDVENHMLLLPDWCSGRFIPVAGDGCGNHYILAVESIKSLYPVYFVDHEDEGLLEEPSYVVASGLWHFLLFLFQKELGHKGWPFEKAKVVQQDSELKKLDPRLLPWTPDSLKRSG
jgi:hypothetical protein